MPQLKATWTVTYALFGERFRFFARRYLGMKDDEPRASAAGKA